MKIFDELLGRIGRRHGYKIDLKKNPEVLEYILEELKSMHKDDSVYNKTSAAAPFGISWMDSWAAHWVVNQQNNAGTSTEAEFHSVLNSLVDLKFKERLTEIKKFVDEYRHFIDEPPDGGPPEPGVPNPPAGPSSFFEPPDGGTPEPGVPPDPTPPPDPDPGPDAGFLNENPWILYWFVSIKATHILDMIDAHFTRRMNDLKGQGQFSK